MKLLILIVLAGIVYSLGTAMFSMVSGKSDGRTVKALTVRVGLSVALFAVLLLLGWLGVLEPNGGPTT